MMPRKGENIYKRKDGRWEGRYKKGRKESGQLKYGYIYGKSYSEVKEKLYSYKLKYQTIVQLHGESASTYEEWAFHWLIQRQETIKPSTYSTYLYKLKRYVFPTIGQLPLNQLTQNNIQELVYIWKKKELKASTIHVLCQIIKKSLSEACAIRMILQSPCQNIYLPKKKSPQPNALSKSEQNQLETTAKSFPLYKGLPVLLALNAGLRIGEISALKWEDIDLKNRRIYIKKTFQRIPLVSPTQKTQLLLDSSKTDKSIRTIPMSFTVYKYLKKWQKKSISPYVCSNKNTPSEPRLITYYFHRIRAYCGLLDVHFHHLRHTFATRCIESNGDIASVSRLLGHASTKTTLDVYTDSFMEGRQQVIAQMDHLKKR